MCFGRCHGSIDSKSSFESINGEMLLLLLLCTLYSVWHYWFGCVRACVSSHCSERVCVCVWMKRGIPRVNERWCMCVRTARMNQRSASKRTKASISCVHLRCFNALAAVECVCALHVCMCACVLRCIETVISCHSHARSPWSWLPKQNPHQWKLYSKFKISGFSIFFLEFSRFIQDKWYHHDKWLQNIRLPQCTFRIISIFWKTFNESWTPTECVPPFESNSVFCELSWADTFTSFRTYVRSACVWSSVAYTCVYLYIPL